MEQQNEGEEKRREVESDSLLKTLDNLRKDRDNLQAEMKDLHRELEMQKQQAESIEEQISYVKGQIKKIQKQSANLINNWHQKQVKIYETEYNFKRGKSKVKLIS